MGGCITIPKFKPSLKELLIEKKKRFFESSGGLESEDEYASIIDSIIEFYDESDVFESDDEITTPQNEFKTFEEEEMENREIEKRFRTTFGERETYL